MGLWPLVHNMHTLCTTCTCLQGGRIDHQIYDQYKKISMNLLILRKSKGLDQAKIAEKCGLTRFQYLRAEGGRPSMTLQTLLKICSAFEVEVGDLFKDPFDNALRVEQREKVKLQSSGAIQEEKYISYLNKNTSIRKIKFGEKQIRSIKLDTKVKFEFLVLAGELHLIFDHETKLLKSGQHLA